MKFRHGRLTLDVDEKWVDASSIAFMAPPDKSLADEFAKQAAAAGAPVHLEMPAEPQSRSNFQLGFRPWFMEDVDEKEFCARELKTMITQIPGAKCGDLEWVQIGDVAAACYDVALQMDGLAAGQFHAMAVFDGNRLMHFCGSAGVGDYDKAKPTFINVLSSVRLEGDPSADT